MNDELRNVVARAYEVFAPYAKAVHRNGPQVCRCPVCVSADIEKALYNTPLREIPSNVLGQYTDSCHASDDGPVADEFRYFLPRAMELIAQYDPPDTIGMETCFQRMGKAKWLEKWPKEETETVHAFYDALVRNTLTQLSHRRPGGGILDNINLDIVLQFIVAGGGDLDRMLDVWEGEDDPQAAVHMAYLMDSICWENGEPYMYMWDAPGALMKQKHRVAHFLLRDEVEARIEKTFFMTDDPKWQAILSEALPLRPSTDKP